MPEKGFPMRKGNFLLVVFLVVAPSWGGEDDLTSLPPNRWVTLHQESPDGGKEFAQAVFVASAERLYLWGTGGKMRDRATFDRYELESFALSDRKWVEAFPVSKKDAWKDRKWPPFRLYGQMGTDGPRMKLVGSGTPNVVRFYRTDGIDRPSPIRTFHQACYDSKRNRILYFGGGKTLALDLVTNTWTDLQPVSTPVACDSLAWGSLCYDPVNDEALLFGGGEAFNLEGGARTWLYDCKKNAWYRLPVSGDEPLPRCTAPIVYDAATKSMVLFGGYDQAAALNETWVYRCAEKRWEKRTPNPSPPPMFDPAAAPLPGGKILACGSNALLGKRPQGSSWDAKETWIYDIAADTWQPLDVMQLPGRWLTAAASEKRGLAFLVSMGSAGRKTLALRYDPRQPVDKEAAKLAGAPPGTRRFKFPEQKESLEAAPKPDGPAQRRFLASLPANRFIDARPPGLVVSRTWSGATLDTDRSEVVYTGGGHSGYSGNDILVYSIAENRWRQDAPPRFPPYLESTNGAVYGFSYGARPWSQHTYLWYAYDPVSRKVIYCARPGIREGETVLLDADPARAFVYEKNKHGNWTWLFDAATGKLSRPSFGRPFDNPWDLCLTATPEGVFACHKGGLFRATVEGDQVRWRSLGGPIPPARGKNYSYEWMPIVHDAKRARLLHLMGNDTQVEVHERGLDAPAWKPVATTGKVAIGRELMLLPKSDHLLLLARNRLFVLNLASSAWRELDVAMPKGVYGTEAAMVYDPRHDVAVLLLPERFSGPLRAFLFRFDPKTAAYRN